VDDPSITENNPFVISILSPGAVLRSSVQIGDPPEEDV